MGQRRLDVESICVLLGVSGSCRTQTNVVCTRLLQKKKVACVREVTYVVEAALNPRRQGGGRLE